MFVSLAYFPYLLKLKALLPRFPRTGQLCLVGGAVRDMLLGRQVADFDFTSPGDPTPLAKALAREVNGHWFWLDEARRQSRVVADGGIADFAPWRAATLALDLAARDFSINAMAIDLAVDADQVLIDPLGGAADLSDRVLRCAGTGVMADDPLRVLKGIRHLAELGLTPEPSTQLSMRDAAPALAGIAPERIRIEFWRLLTAQESALGLRWLVELGVGAALFGILCTPQDIERMSRALQDAASALRSLVSAVPETASRLSETVEQGLTRERLLLWYEVASRIEAGLPMRLADSWHCGGQTIKRLAALAAADLPLDDLATVPCRVRPLSLWALQFGPNPRDLFYMMKIRHPVAAQLTDQIREIEALDSLDSWPPLVDGHWLADELGLTGPALGRAQTMVRRAEMRGEVADSVQAKKFLVAKLPNCS